ncbi:MAG: peptide chain release factor 1 [Deltaproteobacteria bacterium]|nr:peptide chain release factor 1 [Deltaproteobacteria bacterium]
MLERLHGVEQRFMEVEGLLSDPKVVSNLETYQKYVREHSELQSVVEAYRGYKKILNDLDDVRELSKDPDPDIKEMARDDFDRLTSLKAAAEQELTLLLLPKDPSDEKNVFLEIRAGTGGEEAALFAADLFRMYARYAETKGYGVEIMSSSEAERGGFKEIVAMISGKGAFSTFKYESGTHRVQRVPATEAQGRIHTSAVTVAVLPEVDDVDVKIDPTELRIDVYRSQGAGGQHVNTTDSAVRITHLPTGLVVTCQDERSQHKNKAKAMKALQARLYDQELGQQTAAQAKDRKTQVGSGDRSERIRTYNYPQNRITDHRIGLTLYKLDAIMEGDPSEFVSALATHHQALALQAGR